jgi:diguanylate cyclase (GGDEF)-like protein
MQRYSKGESMNRDYKLKTKFRKKYTITPILIVGVIFVLSFLLMTENIRSYYYDIIRDESHRLSKSYSHNLEIAAKAKDTTNELMEQKLIGTGEIVYNLNGLYSMEKLREIAKPIGVDVILVYSSDGVIRFSSTGEYVGWVAEEGHPVHDFMISGDEIRVEQIRPDSESGQLFKYGYYRLQNGYFVQVGIKAENVQEFLESFEVQRLLDQMHNDGYVLKANFIDTKNIITESSDLVEVGNIAGRNNPDAVHFEEGSYSWISEYEGKNSFFSTTPVNVNGRTIGTLGLVHSLDSTEKAIDNIMLLGSFLMLAIAALIIGFNRAAYKNDKKLTRMAYIDSLTQLPNKAFLMDELKEWCTTQSTKNNALYLINISNFKALNMAFGYDFGDSVLRRVADQLTMALNKQYDIFRFASDRFVLLAKGYKDRSELDRLTLRIFDSIDKGIIAHGYTKSLNMNMAIVETGNKYKDPDDIIRDATIALDFVGTDGNYLYAYFDEAMINGLRREEQIEAEIVQAIMNPASNRLFLDYQPIYSTTDMRITAFEALARLNSPTLGTISPVEFIAIAEKRKLMVQLGNWIVDSALMFIKEIEREGFKDLKIAINISAAQLQDEGFLARLRKSIFDTRVSPTNIELEVTESIILDNYNEINKSLGQLREEGVSIAVDDFGTGYSSFARLNQLNIDVIKIDKYFIDKILFTDRDKLLTGDIISLAHRLGLKVVAEGVEDELQREYLIEHNCDYLQGYLLSKPVNFNDALALIRQNYNT